MKPLTKIVFTTDFSEVSANALKYAIQFSNKINAKLIVLHVLWPSSEALDFPSAVAQATQNEVENAKKSLDQFIARGVKAVGLDESKFKVETTLVIGSADREIIEFLKTEEVDLVIIGSKKTDATPLLTFLGGTATNVVKNSPCPILVIPEGVAYKTILSVVYASNLTDADPFVRRWLKHG